MSGKEKVSFVRSKDFESIDDELTEALNGLDEANDRILKLLETEPPPITGEAGAQPAPEEESPEKPLPTSGPQG
ncbi:MAG TPA: hypothetical protein PLI09_18770 [Candidatus Hydrogenedentes bacterium]|nr:hypothetical protein [Candidatus Hydrogenedentota bacterium]